MALLFFAAFLLWARSTSPGAELVNRYSFVTDASDSVGGAHGALVGGAAISNGAVLLNGTGAYVDLPNGLVATRSNVTFEVWVTDHGSGTWARIFDFGFSTAGEGAAATGTNYLFLTPQGGAGALRAAITVGGSGTEQIVEWSGTRLPIGVVKHVVWTIDAGARVGRLYVDGTLVGENPGMNFHPAMLGVTVNNWLGRSQWIADPYLNGSITEFRIYDGALSAAEIQLSYGLGPDNCPWDGPVSILAQPQSQVVSELGSASFVVAFAGRRPVSLQWYRNGVPVPGGTNSTLCIGPVALTNHGDVYAVALTNTYAGQVRWAWSSNAVLSVAPDTNPPVLLRAFAMFPSEVLVVFSEGLRPDTATNVANYTITNRLGQLAVTAARFGEHNSQIILSTAAQVEGETYTLIVNNVRDLAAAANPIAPGSRVSFASSRFNQANISVPLLEGAVVPVEGGLDMWAPGRGIGSTNDAFVFARCSYTNDFDVQVRLESLGFGSAWTRAGLMARNGLSSNAAFAAVMVAAGPAGCHFQWRSATDAQANMSGLFPVNFPHMWLRLRRVGNVFAGYAGCDGRQWEFLGSATIAMSNVVQVGLALTAGASAGVVPARFREFGGGQGAVFTNLSLPFEPPGPCSRRTALVITEIMYNPPASWPGNDELEFIELWNSGLVTEDLTGHRLDGDISFSFPPGTRLAPGQFLVVARNPAAASAFYGVECVGPYSGALPNGSGVLRLLNELGGRLLEIEYRTQWPWPVAPDGTGHSLVLRRPSYGEADPRAWGSSDRLGGSPGAHDPVGPEPARGVVINEFLAHAEQPLEDYIELFNTTTNAIDLSGAWLADGGDRLRFQLPLGTVIPPRGWLVYTESQLGFGLAAAGGQIFLFNSNVTRVLDAVSFGGQASGVSYGRYPDGAPGFAELAARTPAGSNAPPLARPVVINEIMYHPISGSDADEYIELFNRGSDAVWLGGWRLEDGVQFTFPSNAVIWPGGYVVVAKNRTNLLAKYPQLNATNTFGDYAGRLRNSSDRIVLSMPVTRVTTNAAGLPITNVHYVAVDEVTYHDGGRWGRWSDGWGSALELIDPRADNALGANWADSDESGKAPWTYIDVTNVLENGQTAAMINQGSYWGLPTRFEFFLQDEGEVLVDNLEFRNNNGPNLLPNGTFDNGAAGWAFEGVVRSSYVQSGVGIGSTPALRLVATGRGDTGPNKARTTLTGPVLTNPPNTGTIRAAVRWLRGSPYIMFRLSGHWMEVSQRLNVPANCGTPGLPNSRLVTNAGPAIFDVAHAPVVPAAGQPVVVTARANDPDGIAQVQLRFRVDPATAHATLNMRDDGTGGDAIAGDGIFSATISGRSSNTLVAFYIYAVDGAGATSRFPPDAPARECLVRWGETLPGGCIGTYRLWLTSSNVAFWTNREKNANDPVDATFVYGNWRAVYNVGALYSGSPFHTPSYNGPVGSFACDYEVNFPPDDKFLGAEALVLTAFDVTSGSFFHNDLTAQVDLTANWMARKLGQQYNYRRHIHMFVNGLRRGTIYDDAQQPNSDMLDQYFPGAEQGQLRKIEDWFEFADNGIDQGITTATITRYNKSSGELDTKRYRWNWRPRVTRNPDDWAPLTNLIVAVNDTSSPNYEGRVRLWMDVPRWLRPIAVRHICGDWDSYGYERGKNMYAYKPEGQPWRLWVWDIELALGYQSRPPTDSIYVIHDPTLRFMITNWPAFHREYLAAFLEAVQTVLLPGAADALLDERYAGFQEHNLPLQSPQTIKNYLATRRAYLQSVLPQAEFAISNPPYTLVTGSNTVVVSGSAPLDVSEILVNGVPYPVTWTSITNWRVAVPLA
ncbi:MAG: lamin tail domain-containing protein, partial [Verrucomicrobiales bacterium]|nr:lamin tail domain-containing protein [Verrucomicrobiales bacterium]